jgi:hypothetical protein
MGKYFKQILYFLAAKIDMPDPQDAIRQAQQSGIEQSDFIREMGEDLMRAALKSKVKPMLPILDSVYLGPWSDAWIATLGDRFELICSKDPQEKNEWKDMMDRYWAEVSRINADLAKDIDPNSKDPVDQMKLKMSSKIWWIKHKLLLPEHAPFLRKMPIPNKYIFSSVQKMFCDEPKNFRLHDIIKTVSSLLIRRASELANLSQRQ